MNTTPRAELAQITALIERAKEQRDRDVAEHCPAEIIALQDEVIAGLEALEAENLGLRLECQGLKAEVAEVKSFWKEAQLRNRNLLEESNDLAFLADQYKAERDKLQAKLDELQRQEPIGKLYVSQHGDSGIGIEFTIDKPEEVLCVGQAVYAAPKALEPTTWKPASSPPPESAGEVLVRMADGRCEIAWPTYWHGSSNAFAQWTFRDPDEDEQPVEWMTIPSHGITKGTP